MGFTHAYRKDTLGLRYGVGLGEAGGLHFEPLAARAVVRDLSVDVVFHEVTLHIGSALYF